MRRFLFLIILFCHLLLFYLYLRHLFLYYISWDEGVYLAGAQRVLNGEIPLRDFFFYHTPGDIYLLALFFKIIGKSFFTAKTMMLFFALAGGYFIARLIYKITKSLNLAGVTSLLLFTILFSNSPLTHHWLGTFIVIFTMVLFLKGIESERAGMLFLSGIMGGITFLINETKGVYLLLFYFLFLIGFEIKRGKIRNLFFFSFGGGTILISYLAFLLITNSFGSYIDTVKWMLTYYNRFNYYPFLYTEFLYIKVSLFESTDIISGLKYLLLLLMMLFIPLCLSLLIIIKYIHSLFKGGNEKKYLILVIIAITYISLFLSSLYHPDLTRIITYNSPLILCLWFSFQSIVEGRRKILLNYLLPVILLIAVVPHYFTEMLRLVGQQKCRIISFNGVIDFAANGPNECSSVSGVANVLISNNQDRTFIYYWSPHLYFLYDIKNATSFDTYIPIYFSKEQIRKIIEELEEKKPNFVIKDIYLYALLKDTNSVLFWQFPVLQRNKVIEEDIVDKYIMTHYHIEYTFPRFLVLRRNTE